MPFKYGIATMTRVPHAFVRVQAVIDGQSSRGVAADLLPPKWFTKDPNKALEAEVEEMIRVLRHAAEAGTGLSGVNVFEVWRELDERQSAWGKRENLAPLLTNFGTSLVERALIEAACRVLRRPFAELMRANEFGLDLGQMHAALKDSRPGDLLPERSLERVTVRHTVGLADPLRDEHIPDNQRLSDGLPQSLESCARVYGLRHFKIKVTGHLDHDVDRLEQIARLLGERAVPDFKFTLDGNEQFHSLEHFRDFWKAVSHRSNLREFLGHLLFVEQPLHRDVALRPEVQQMFEHWKDHPPVIIDESDATIDSLPAALRLGYAGTSHKNCKGIFKGVANRCLLSLRAKEDRARPWLMSGEDLATIGPISVLQDLTVMAALGIESVERNGHHYFTGLSMFPRAVQEQVLRGHGDLYEPSPLGWPRLRIQSGSVSIGSLNRSPFGVDFEVDLASFTPVDQYRFESA